MTPTKVAVPIPHRIPRPSIWSLVFLLLLESRCSPLVELRARKARGEPLRSEGALTSFVEVPVEKSQPQKLPGLIRDLRAELRRPDRRPRAQLYELARRRIEAPHEILELAKSDRRWSFTLAEIMTGTVARPHELATGLVVAIADELEEESELLADSSETWRSAPVE